MRENKKEKNLDVTLGLQMVLLPEFIDQIIPLAKLGKNLALITLSLNIAAMTK